MKTKISPLSIWTVLLIAGTFLVSGEEKSATNGRDSSVEATALGKSVPADAEDKFGALLKNAVLTGRWASLKDGVLGEEKTGDEYRIVSVDKRTGDQWILSAKMKYRDQEL